MTVLLAILALVAGLAGLAYAPRLTMALRLWRDPYLSYSWRRAWRRAGFYHS